MQKSMNTNVIELSNDEIGEISGAWGGWNWGWSDRNVSYTTVGWVSNGGPYGGRYDTFQVEYCAL